MTTTSSGARTLFAIHCLDDISGEMVERGARFGGSAKRIAHYAEHKAYVTSCNDLASPNYIRKVCGGPLESDDMKFMIGSFFIVEATREEAERFNQNDPFFKHGVWSKVRRTVHDVLRYNYFFYH